MEIYRSTSRDHDMSGGGVEARDPTKITFILVMIVTLFLVLVCPSMILSFLKDCVIHTYSNVHHYQIAVVMTNLTQALNFSINFLLYCAVSPKFRQQITGEACKKMSMSASRTIVSDAYGRNMNNNGHYVQYTCQYELVEFNTPSPT
jgi:hypothetical protein